MECQSRPTAPPAVHALFVCARNRLRSPTAEQLFGATPGLEVDSAGLSPDAETPLTPEQVEWANVIFVMEKTHRQKLTQKFRTHLADKRIVCLDIPDRYDYMDPKLVQLLTQLIPRHLPAVFRG